MFIEARGSGTPIVLIHGFGVDHRILLPLEPVFEAAGGWRRLYVDLPGMGRSPMGDITSADEMAEAVTDAVRSRVGPEPFALVGNSYGAVFARALAHGFGSQVLGLATVAGVFATAHAERTTPPRTVLHEEPGIYGDVAPEIANGYRDYAVWQSAAGLQDYVEHVQPGVEAADHAALERFAEHYALSSEPEDEASGPFERPALFVAGRQDEVVGYVDAWRRFEHYPRASYLVLDAAGHNLLGEQLPVVSAAVAEWLGRMRA